MRDATGPVDIESLTTRQRILREASMLFAARGYAGTSTREIATAVGIRQPSLFHHFGSKQDMMVALLDSDLTGSTALAEIQAAAPGPPAVRLLRYLIIDIAVTCNSPYNLTRISDEHVLTDPALAHWLALLERLHSARRTMIEQGIAAGDFIDVDPDMAQRAVTWMIRGNIADVAGRGVVDADRIARELSAFALRSLLRDPARLPDLMSCALAPPDR